MLRYVAPALLLAGVHFPDHVVEGRRLCLKPHEASPTGDRLVADSPSPDLSSWRKELGLLRKALRRMGVLPLRQVDPGFGASIHYAGTLPYSEVPVEGGLRPDGLLFGTKNVYVADASGFTALPAKGITLSLMANAHRICSKIDAHG